MCFYFLLLSAKSVSKSVLCSVSCLVKDFKNDNSTLTLSLSKRGGFLVELTMGQMVFWGVKSCLRVLLWPQGDTQIPSNFLLFFLFLATPISASRFTYIQLVHSVDDMKLLTNFYAHYDYFCLLFSLCYFCKLYVF